MIRLRDLRRINKIFYCANCYRKHRAERRKETREKNPEKKIIEQLEKKIRNEYKQTEYAKKHNGKVRKWVRGGSPKLPILREKKKKSNSYISKEDKQNLFRILIKRGLEYDEVIKRIDDVVKQQKIVRDKMKRQQKSEKEILIKQAQMLEELLNS